MDVGRIGAFACLLSVDATEGVRNDIVFSLTVEYLIVKILQTQLDSCEPICRALARGQRDKGLMIRNH